MEHFFWRPVAAMIEQRRVAAQKGLAEAEEKNAKADSEQAEITKTRDGFVQERDTILAKAHETAEEARKARLEEAAKEAASLEAAAKTAIETEKAEAEKAWAEQASRLAVEIAQRLAARLDGPLVRAAFLEWLVGEIRALPDSERQSVTTLEAISATPLASDEQERTRQQIGEAFGASPQITFAVDGGLIAGLELRGPHLAVSNSWRADLARILAELAHV
ncbi:ATP synthase subunit b [Candidatus Terasakiella magnetica]|nr:ATP synthase subunit b [Candidatus Terasakiella magnetica]